MMETRVDIEMDREYILRMPCSEAMMHARKHGHLQRLKIIRHELPQSNDTTWTHFQVLFPSEITGEWYASGYTYGEVGLYHQGDGLYGYLPDLAEEPEKIQAQAAQVAHDLDVILTNAGAVTININMDIWR
jgi:hypothetical protein